MAHKPPFYSFIWNWIHLITKYEQHAVYLSVNSYNMPMYCNVCECDCVRVYVSVRMFSENVCVCMHACVHVCVCLCRITLKIKKILKLVISQNRAEYNYCSFI